MVLAEKNILLVEDDLFIGDMITRKLELEGATCQRALNGEEGLMKLKENDYNFDIIVTDIMMSKMNGYEMVQKIKEDEHAQSLPIIVLTNRNSATPELERITELGIEGKYIKSSTALHDLVKIIADAIENKRTDK